MLYDPGYASGLSPAPPRPAAAATAIGLVNMMPKAAMPMTAARYQRLLVAEGVTLRYFAPAGADAGCEPIDALWDARLDGIIVTGTEPRADKMTREPAWPLLRELVDWAAENVVSAIWSCFAAHAAVYRLDSLSRQKLPDKLSGVFACGKLAEHPIMENMPSRWLVPHSRLNGLSETALNAAGYTLLSGGPPNVGVDSFIKRHGSSLFLFLQGHPEYDAATLADEYRRDMNRFLSGRSARPPNRPVYDPGPAGWGAGTGWQGPARAFHTGWLSYIRGRSGVRA